MESKDILTLSISTAALVVSVGTFTINLLQKRGDTQRALRQQLTDIVGKLNGVFDAWNKLRIEHVDDWDSPVVTSIRINMNGQKLFYARQMDQIVRQIPRLVTETDYDCMARAFWDNSDFYESEKYFQKAIAVAHRPRNKATHARGLARLLFELSDFEDGRKLFRWAVDAAADFEGDPDYYFAGETLRRWATTEREFGDQARADALFQEAEQTIAKDTNAPRRTRAAHALKLWLGANTQPSRDRVTDTAFSDLI